MLHTVAIQSVVVNANESFRTRQLHFENNLQTHRRLFKQQVTFQMVRERTKTRDKKLEETGTKLETYPGNSLTQLG